VLARTAGPVGGEGTTPRRLVDLIDTTFLAGIGYDAGTQRITFPDDHPLLGPLYCPVAGCSGPARIGIGAICGSCYRRWVRRPAGTVLAEFLATPKPRAPQRHRPSTFTATVDLGWYGPALRDQVLALISLQRDSGRAGLGVLILRMFSWIPGDSCQDARVAGVVDSSVDARGEGTVVGGLWPGPFLLVVTARSWPVSAWISRWMAAGFNSR